MKPAHSEIEANAVADRAALDAAKVSDFGVQTRQHGNNTASCRAGTPHIGFPAAIGAGGSPKPGVTCITSSQPVAAC